MGKPKFQEIWKWGIITTLAFVLGFAMSDLGLLGTFKYVFLAYLALAFFISLAVVQVLWTTTPKIIPFLKTPRPNNLRVYTGSLHGDIYTLKFRSTEWRYFFNGTIAQAEHSSTMESKSMGFFEWRGLEPFPYSPIKRFRFYEINYIQIDEKDNSFWIKTLGHKVKLGQGSYGFKITVSTRMSGKFRVNSKLKFMPYRVTNRDVYLMVTYEGGNRISVRIENKNSA